MSNMDSTADKIEKRETIYEEVESAAIDFVYDQNECYEGRMKVSIVILMILLILILMASATLAAVAYTQSITLRNQINILQEEMNKLNNNLTMLSNDFQTLTSRIETNLSQLQIINDMTVRSVLRELDKIAMNISNSTKQSLESLTTELIQALNVFESYAAIKALSLPFSSGMYWVRTSNGSSVLVYCSMELSCNHTIREWKRIAYLNASDSIGLHCPSGLQLRSDPLHVDEVLVILGARLFIIILKMYRIAA